MYTNTGYLNANGFGTYNALGALVQDQFPQPAIWDTYAKMYRYYMTEYIELTWIPNRIQIAIEPGSNNIWQMPTMINTFPKFTQMLPVNTSTAANANMAYLSARKKPQVCFGTAQVTKGINVENNLLVR